MELFPERTIVSIYHTIWLVDNNKKILLKAMFFFQILGFLAFWYVLPGTTMIFSCRKELIWKS